jgi:hypothetical protein
MAVLAEIEARLRAEREASKHDEVWDGVHVVSPRPDNEHQALAAELWLVLRRRAREGSFTTA